MYFIVFVAFSFVSTVSCNFRIINGDVDTSNSFPYVVSIQTLPFNSHICTASIIDKYWILTAGHCLYGRQTVQLQIEAGTTALQRTRDVLHNISEYFLHPNYSKTQAIISNDVGLIKMAEPLDFDNENIGPIQLGTLQSEDVMAIGFGRTAPHNTSRNKTLNFILLDVMGIEKCTLMHKEVNNEVDSRTHICAYGGIGRTVCFGDSGGPLIDVATSRLVGVFSGLEDCTGKYPVLYMKISEFIDWINSVTGLNLLLD